MTWIQVGHKKASRTDDHFEQLRQNVSSTYRMFKKLSTCFKDRHRKDLFQFWVKRVSQTSYKQSYFHISCQSACPPLKFENSISTCIMWLSTYLSSFRINKYQSFLKRFQLNVKETVGTETTISFMWSTKVRLKKSRCPAECQKQR